VSSNRKSPFTLGVVVGSLGVIAGIGLLFTESWLIGIFGGIASAGLLYKAYIDHQSD
jgi:ABC-type transport system involved in cytochrome bd biosynthesis fused ATPase/permease subunit